MSAPPTETLIHFVPSRSAHWTGCKDHVYDEAQGWRSVTEDPGRVTCFACRRSEIFKQAQLGDGVGVPTPLRDVIAADPELAELALEAKRRELETQAAREMVAAARNERGMFVIEETIHHGDYRSVRRVEVYSINAVTVDCIIQSSAYCYGSWLNPDNPAHREPRNAKLHGLVEDLRHGRTNRDIGWSTFRLITKH